MDDTNDPNSCALPLKGEASNPVSVVDDQITNKISTVIYLSSKTESSKRDKNRTISNWYYSFLKRKRYNWQSRGLHSLPQSLSSHKYLRIALLRKRHRLQRPNVIAAFCTFTDLLTEFSPSEDFVVFKLIVHSVVTQFSYWSKKSLDNYVDWVMDKSDRYFRNGQELRIDFLIQDNEVVVKAWDDNTDRFRSVQINIENYAKQMSRSVYFPRAKEDMVILSSLFKFDAKTRLFCGFKYN